MTFRTPLIALVVLPLLACSDGETQTVTPPDAAPDVAQTVDAGPDAPPPLDAGPDVAPPIEAGPDVVATPCIFADPKTGNDSNGGTALAPVKTFTRAVKLVSSPGCIVLAPGLYDDVGNGESFPLNIPPSVTVTGDEKNKGLAQGAAVRVQGSLDGSTAPMVGMIQPGANSVIAGVSFGFTGKAFRVPMYLTAPGVTLKNDTFDHISAPAAIYVGASGKDYVITGNDIYKNTNVGLAMISGGVGSKVEGNSIHDNTYGIEVDLIPNADFGGGAQGSLGGNQIYCNATTDFWTVQTNGVLAVKNNLWDHNPPQIGNGTGDDVNKSTNAGASVDTTGAKLVANPCN